MTRSLLLAPVVALLAGCAQPAPASLYAWGDFTRLQYEALQHRGAEGEHQIQAMQGQVEAAAASGATLPPGFRAHLGYLELLAGHDDAARACLQSEKTAFPESGPFIDPLLDRIDAQRQKAHHP